MSEVIVRMEMPKNCAECPIGNYFHTNCPLQDDDKSYGQFQAYKKNERPSWCPIKSVLPDNHGDLVDLDEVKQLIRRYRVISIDNDYLTVERLFEEKLHTVIRAERQTE